MRVLYILRMANEIWKCHSNLLSLILSLIVYPKPPLLESRIYHNNILFCNPTFFVRVETLQAKQRGRVQDEWENKLQRDDWPNTFVMGKSLKWNRSFQEFLIIIHTFCINMPTIIKWQTPGSRKSFQQQHTLCSHSSHLLLKSPPLESKTQSRRVEKRELEKGTEEERERWRGKSADDRRQHQHLQSQA